MLKYDLLKKYARILYVQTPRIEINIVHTLTNFLALLIIDSII